MPMFFDHFHYEEPVWRTVSSRLALFSLFLRSDGLCTLRGFLLFFLLDWLGVRRIVRVRRARGCHYDSFRGVRHDTRAYECLQE